jgi:hypothetical protein
MPFLMTSAQEPKPDKAGAKKQGIKGIVGKHGKPMKKQAKPTRDQAKKAPHKAVPTKGTSGKSNNPNTLLNKAVFQK